MADDGRLRRSLLFVPGDDTRKIAKATTLPADSVILDLEDGVGISAKEDARKVVFDVLTSGEHDFGPRERLVRLNGDTTGLQADDLRAIIDAKPDGFVLPKVETSAVIRYVAHILTNEEARMGLAPGTFKLLCLVETARGIVNLKDIASSDARLVGLIFGADDMAASLGATRTPGDPEVEHEHRELRLYCAAYDLQCIDTPWVNIADLAGLRDDTARAMRLGYTGRTLIHPSHIEPVNEIFAPSDEAIDYARRMIEAHDAHQAQGKGVFVFEGRMIDMPGIRQSERVMSRAKAAGKL
jgi:citrate lyase beta subunit